MAVPSFQEFMLPFLEFIQDGKEHRITELFPHLAQSANSGTSWTAIPAEAGHRFQRNLDSPKS